MVSFSSSVLTAPFLWQTMQYTVGAIVLSLACIYLMQLKDKFELSKLPAINHDSPNPEKQRLTYLQSARKLYEDGYKKFKDDIFRMGTSDGRDHIVIPIKFLPELRRLPDDVLSFNKSIENSLETKYTKLITDDMHNAHSIKADLTPALVRLNPIISEEVEDSVNSELPPCLDWTPVKIYSALLNIVAKVSGRIFVGSELCHNKEYLDLGVNYTVELINAQHAVKKMRPILRPFLAAYLPSVRQLAVREKRVLDFLTPIVEARLAARNQPGYEAPDDMLQWSLDRNSAELSVYRLVKNQMGLIFAAIHTTTMLATHIFYTLAAMPEYIQPLREEIRTVLAENGGIMTTKALQQMEKLDSIMKENIRMYPPGLTSFSRKVLKGFTLSNGQYIPAGADIEVPSGAIYSDSNIYENPETFDGFRFYRMRQAARGEGGARNQFVSLSEHHLGFGYGRHACPGRFFAANEIKMIVARTLLEFDIKNVDGVQGRIRNIEVARGCMPDGSKQLLFRKVRV